MSELVVTHTFEDGSMVRGTERGDGAGEVLKPLGWRWGRSLRAWYLPSSRERAPGRGRLTHAIDQLRQKGHVVEVSVVVAPVDGYAAAEERHVERLEETREVLTTGLRRHEAVAVSEGDSSDLGSRERQAAAETREQVDRITEHLINRRSPRGIRGRIAHLQHAVATGQQTLNAIEHAGERGTDRSCQVRDQLELDRGQLAHWQQASQQVPPVPGTVTPGDQVRIRGHWRTVIRVNAKSVTVHVSGWGTGRSPWADVQEHRAAHLQQPPPRQRPRVGRPPPRGLSTR